MTPTMIVIPKNDKFTINISLLSRSFKNIVIPCSLLALLISLLDLTGVSVTKDSGAKECKVALLISLLDLAGVSMTEDSGGV